MSSSRKLLSALALALLLLAVDSAPFSRSSSSSRSRNISPSDTDLRGRDLVRLLNSPVYLAEKMWRPIGSSASSSSGSFISPFARAISPQHDPSRHSGVRVTLRDGTKWLVHKGDGYGRASETVVTDARHMGPAWKVERTRNFHGRRTVSDLIRVGGRNYNLLTDN
ncbi:hypothetical protein INR49_007974 [Caranx melampygus]|nr:hypothetical protein INR49_007974 [Caranx melampygus]